MDYMAKPIQFNVRGTAAPLASPKPDTETSQFLTARVSAEIKVPVSARGVQSAAASVSAQADPDKDVIELEFEGNVHQFINPQQLRDDLAKRRPAVRGAGPANPDVVDVPADFGGGPSRGG